jgi:hypothetical protein
MNRPLTRWLILITFVFIILVGVSIPVLTNYGQGANGSVPPVVSTTEMVDLGATQTATPFNTPVPTATQVLTVTPIATAQNNCTYSARYWLSHVGSWPSQFVVHTYRYTMDDALKTLQTTQVDLTTLLFLHFNATYLNIINGSDPTAIEQAALDASDWLENHPSGSYYSVADAQQALQLTQKLNDYNNGKSGPGRCPDEASSQIFNQPVIQAPVLSTTPSSAIILTSIAGFAPTATITVTPTAFSIRTPYSSTVPTPTKKPHKPRSSPPTLPPPPPSGP